MFIGHRSNKDLTEEHAYARRHVPDRKALPLFKRQEQPWKNETRSSSPTTTSREASPVVVSSSSATEQRQSTSSSKSDKDTSVVGTPTRSLSSSPEGSPSESIGPITSKRNDVSSTSAAIVGSSTTHVSTSKQELSTSTATSISISSQARLPDASSNQPTSKQLQSTSISVSPQAPQPAASSTQPMSVGSSTVTPVQGSSILQSSFASASQLSASAQASSSKEVQSISIPASSQAPQPATLSNQPIFVGSSTVTSVQASSVSQSPFATTSQLSASAQTATSQPTLTPIPTPTPSIISSELSQRSTQSSVSLVSSSVIQFSQGVTTSSSVGQQLPSSSTVSSQQGSSISTSTQIPVPQSGTSSWTVPSLVASSTASSTSSPVQPPPASLSMVSVSSSSVPSGAPASQALSSQGVSSGIVTSSPSINSAPSDQLPLSSSAATLTITVGSSVAPLSSPLSSLVNAAPSGQIPLTLSATAATVTAGNPQELSSSSLSSSNSPGPSGQSPLSLSATATNISAEKSQGISSSSLRSSSSAGSSGQTPLSSSAATPTILPGTSQVLPSSSLTSSSSPSSSSQTPLSSSAVTSTILPGTSQGLSSSSFTVITYTIGTISSGVVSPSITSSAAAISSSLGGVSSSIVASGQASSAYVSVTETWTPSASSTVSATSLVPPPASTGVSTFISSGTSISPTPVVSSNTGSVPASESINSLPPVPSASSNQASMNVTVSGVTSPLLSSTSLLIAPSEVASSSTITPTGTQSWASPTMSTNLGALNSSTYLSLSAASSIAVVGPTSLLSSSSVSFLGSSVTTWSSSSAVPALSTSSLSQRQASVTPAAAPTPSVLTNGTSVLAPQVPSSSAQGHQSWNISFALSGAESTTTLKGVALPTGSLTSSVSIHSETSQTSAVVASSNFDASISSQSSAASLSTSTASTFSTLRSDVGATRTIATYFSSTEFPTSTAAASPPPPPPLTTPQKAGVAIAGTTGLLLAVIAAIYLTRRHYTKPGRRSSTGSIYPKVAYLYDPPAGGNGGGDYPDETLMSGGSSGMPLIGNNSRAPTSTPNLGHRHSTATSPMRFSDPGNPFRDPRDPFRDSNEFAMTTPTNTAAAFTAAIKGYTSAPQKSPSTTDFPTMQPSRDMAWASPSSNQIMSDARLPNRSSILSEIASMAYNPNVYSNGSASRYERLSPYGFHQNHSLPCVRETTYTDSVRDPFEHDLLLQVDTRTETPDSVTVYAPPATSNTPARATPPVKVLSRNPWASSMLDPSAAQLPTRPLSRLVEQSPISPDATIVASERYSLAYDNEHSTTYIVPSQTHADGNKSPISPPPGPIHRGWDDIKRWSADKIVPSPVALSPPLRHWSPPPNKKKSMPQLRRKEGVLFSSAEGTHSSDRLPLKVKVPFTNHKNSSAEGTRLSQFAKLDARSRNDDNIRSPDSTFHHSVHSLTSMIQKKKSGDLEFACAGV